MQRKTKIIRSSDWEDAQKVIDQLREDGNKDVRYSKRKNAQPYPLDQFTKEPMPHFYVLTYIDPADANAALDDEEVDWEERRHKGGYKRKKGRILEQEGSLAAEEETLETIPGRKKRLTAEQEAAKKRRSEWLEVMRGSRSGRRRRRPATARDLGRGLASKAGVSKRGARYRPSSRRSISRGGMPRRPAIAQGIGTSKGTPRIAQLPGGSKGGSGKTGIASGMNLDGLRWP